MTIYGAGPNFSFLGCQPRKNASRIAAWKQAYIDRTGLVYHHLLPKFSPEEGRRRRAASLSSGRMFEFVFHLRMAEIAMTSLPARLRRSSMCHAVSSWVQRMWMAFFIDTNDFGRPMSFPDLQQVVIPRQLSQMHFDGVAVRPRGFLGFFARDFPSARIFAPRFFWSHLAIRPCASLSVPP